MVLVAGGTSLEIDTAELYDPATGTWSLTGSLNTMRKDHAATLLLNGMVLVTGGALMPQSCLSRARNSMIRESWWPRRSMAEAPSMAKAIELTFNFHASQSDDGTSAGYFPFAIPPPASR